LEAAVLFGISVMHDAGLNTEFGVQIWVTQVFVIELRTLPGEQEDAKQDPYV
jgi:hypothetical protein